jgi:amidase
MKPLFLLVLSCLLLTALPPAARANDPQAQIKKALHELLGQMVDPTLAAKPDMYGPAPGAVLLVTGPDFHFLEAAGFADVDKKTPVRPQDRFEIGSNTKMFTAALLVQLAEQEKLGLDDHLSKWLPEWAAKVPGGEEITLRMLANHTSGLPDYADDIIGQGVKDDKLMHKSYTPAEIVDYALKHGKQEFTPGEKGRWQYCNTGYILLGMILEKAAGKKYGDLLRERIFTPLGLTDTSFPDTVPNDPALVQGYVSYPGGKNTTGWNLSQGWAAGGIISTAADMHTFLLALGNGKLFKDQSTLLAMAEFVHSNDIEEHLASRGYGLGLIEYVKGVWGHGGQTLGYESELMFVPGTEITMVALPNAGQGPVLQMRSLAPLLQKMAGIEPETANVFPRPEPKYNAKRGLDFKPFVREMNTLTRKRYTELDKLLLSADVTAIQKLLAGGATSSHELAAYYLQRIQSYDWNLLNSVMEINPELFAAADALDRERKQGKSRGPLHGIPVLFKDNIAVRGLHATAGAWAMREWQPTKDAALVSNLRQAGVLILGKANLSEWANYMDPAMPSGFSVLGGQTRNPYGPYEVLGSSSGSAVAASANFAPVTVGTETQGSIIQPASINGVVAIKTTHGLLRGDNIIPLVDWMDVPGPMGRTVTDAAVLLGGMAGEADYSAALSLDKAQNMRVGVIVFDEKTAMEEAKQYGFPKEQLAAVRDELLAQNKALRETAAGFKGSGVELVEINAAELPPHAPLTTILPNGFRLSLDAFLQNSTRKTPVTSLAEVITINEQDPANRAPYGQRFLIGARDSKMSEAEYRPLVKKLRTETAEALAGIFTRHRINALVSGSQAYALAGFPAITVPAGYRDNGEPFGLIMLGNRMGEADLITAAYAFEQTTQARKLPKLDRTIEQINTLNK